MILNNDNKRGIQQTEAEMLTTKGLMVRKDRSLKEDASEALVVLTANNPLRQSLTCLLS